MIDYSVMCDIFTLNFVYLFNPNLRIDRLIFPKLFCVSIYELRIVSNVTFFRCTLYVASVILIDWLISNRSLSCDDKNKCLVKFIDLRH